MFGEQHDGNDQNARATSEHHGNEAEPRTSWLAGCQRIVLKFELNLKRRRDDSRVGSRGGGGPASSRGCHRRHMHALSRPSLSIGGGTPVWRCGRCGTCAESKFSRVGIPFRANYNGGAGDRPAPRTYKARASSVCSFLVSLPALITVLRTSRALLAFAACVPLFLEFYTITYVPPAAVHSFFKSCTPRLACSRALLHSHLTENPLCSFAPCTLLPSSLLSPRSPPCRRCP